MAPKPAAGADGAPPAKKKAKRAVLTQVAPASGGMVQTTLSGIGAPLSAVVGAGTTGASASLAVSVGEGEKGPDSDVIVVE